MRQNFHPSAISLLTLLTLRAVPVAFPQNIRVEVVNSTVAEVRWDSVPTKSLRGQLKGFKVH